MRVDVIGERKDLFLVAVVILHRDLKIDAIAHTLEIDHFVVQRGLVFIQVFNE